MPTSVVVDRVIIVDRDIWSDPGGESNLVSSRSELGVMLLGVDLVEVILILLL